MPGTFLINIRRLAKDIDLQLPDTGVKLVGNHYGGDECCVRTPVYRDVWRPLVINCSDSCQCSDNAHDRTAAAVYKGMAQS